MTRWQKYFSWQWRNKILMTFQQKSSENIGQLWFFWVLDAKKCFDTRKERLQTRSKLRVLLILSWVCQNISKRLKLNRPRLRSLSLLFRTRFSIAWSIEFYIMVTSQSDCCISVIHVPTSIYLDTRIFVLKVSGYSSNESSSTNWDKYGINRW